MSKKVAILVGDGFEDIEVLAPNDCLNRAGIETAFVSVMPSKTIKTGQGVFIEATDLIDGVDLDSFDMLVVPGGNGGVENIEKNQKALDAIESFMEKGKLVGSICAGPTILAKLGLLKDRGATCYPGCEYVFPEGSYKAIIGTYVDENLITASGPGQALDFGLELVRALAGDDAAKQVKEGMLIQ